MQRQGIPSRKAKTVENRKEKAKATKGKAKDRGLGQRHLASSWRNTLEEETPGSIGSATRETVKVIDEDRYEPIRRPRPRTLGQYAPEMFAVGAERPVDSTTRELPKKRFCGDDCSKNARGHQSCKVKSRGICSVERVIKKRKEK